MTPSLFLTIIAKTPNYEKETIGDPSVDAFPELEVQYPPRVLSSYLRHPPPTFRNWHDHRSQGTLEEARIKDVPPAAPGRRLLRGLFF